MLAVTRARGSGLLEGFDLQGDAHLVAEDYATAYILTTGRTVFGVGRGYHTREVETFGAPIIDQEANRELFEEQVEIIFKAFNTESFSHKGKHYTIPADVPYRGYQLKELTLVPRPVNLPVECWQPIVSASSRGIEFMIRHGIKGLVGGGAATIAGAPAGSAESLAAPSTPRGHLAWDAYVEGAVKAVAALAVSVPRAHEVILSGRLARVAATHGRTA